MGGWQHARRRANGVNVSADGRLSLCDGPALHLHSKTAGIRLQQPLQTWVHDQWSKMDGRMDSVDNQLKVAGMP